MSQISRDIAELKALMRQYPAQAYNFSLNKTQSTYLILLKIKPRTVKEISKAVGVTHQGVSYTLLSMYKKGIIGRLEKPDPTGGYYFLYLALPR